MTARRSILARFSAIQFKGWVEINSLAWLIVEFLVWCISLHSKDLVGRKGKLVAV